MISVTSNSSLVTLAAVRSIFLFFSFPLHNLVQYSILLLKSYLQTYAKHIYIHTDSVSSLGTILRFFLLSLQFPQIAELGAQIPRLIKVVSGSGCTFKKPLHPLQTYVSVHHDYGCYHHWRDRKDRDQRIFSFWKDDNLIFCACIPPLVGLN